MAKTKQELQQFGPSLDEELRLLPRPSVLLSTPGPTPTWIEVYHAISEFPEAWKLQRPKAGDHVDQAFHQMATMLHDMACNVRVLYGQLAEAERQRDALLAQRETVRAFFTGKE